MYKEANNVNNKKKEISAQKVNKAMFITKKSCKEEISYKKLFKTNKEEYISTDDSPKKEVPSKFKDNKDNIKKCSLDSEIFPKNIGTEEINIETKKNIKFQLQKHDIKEKENSKKSIKKQKGRKACLSERKKDEEDYNTINEIINNHKDKKRFSSKINGKKSRLFSHKIKAIKKEKSKNKNEIEKAKKYKKPLVLDYILIENCKLFDYVFNSLKPKEKNNEFLKKKRKLKKNFIVFKDTNNMKIKTTILEEEIKDNKKDKIKNDMDMDIEEEEEKKEEKVKGKAIQKIKEKMKGIEK